MKILMVCLGNICRSPLAHGILEDKIEKLGLDWEVDSAGTAGYHEGELPDKRSIAVAELHNLDITNQRSRKLVKRDLEYFDLILAMDTSNYNNILALATKDQKSKVKMMLNYTFPQENRVVPDPYYGGGFDYVFELLEEAITKMIDAEYTTSI